MFEIGKKLSRSYHALAGNALFGVIGIVAALLQGNRAVMIGGVVVLVLAVVLMGVAHTAALLGGRVRTGVIVGVQQPQLTDVRAHMRPPKELAQVP